MRGCAAVAACTHASRIFSVEQRVHAIFANVFRESGARKLVERSVTSCSLDYGVALSFTYMLYIYIRCGNQLECRLKKVYSTALSGLFLPQSSDREREFLRGVKGEEPQSRKKWRNAAYPKAISQVRTGSYRSIYFRSLNAACISIHELQNSIIESSCGNK